jgi:hypothetical protein
MYSISQKGKMADYIIKPKSSVRYNILVNHISH